MVDVVVLNTSEDTLALLHEVLDEEGLSSVGDFIVGFRQGKQDIAAFFQKHQPRAILYDLAIPYDENWQFLVDTVIPASGMSRQSFVLTTTNKHALELIVGETPAIEMIGKPFDIEEIVEAVHRALKAK